MLRRTLERAIPHFSTSVAPNQPRPLLRLKALRLSTSREPVPDGSDGEDDPFSFPDHHKLPPDVARGVDAVVAAAECCHADTARARALLERCGAAASEQLVVAALARLRNSCSAAHAAFRWAAAQPGYVPGRHACHSMLAILAKHRRFDDARALVDGIHSQLIAHHVFDRRPAPWHALLKAYSHSPFPQEALHLFRHARLCMADDTYAFMFALTACVGLAWPRAGAQLHGLVVRKGFEFHAYVHTALVNMYVACGRLEDARVAFDEMPVKNAVSWNVMITGFAGRGDVEYARLLFERMPCRNIVSWTGLIDGYTRSCHSAEAIALFGRMISEGVSPSEITVLAIVPAIANMGGILMGEALHGYCEKKGLLVLDVRVGNSLIDMYAKIGSIQSSLKVFNQMMERRNLVSWTSIISGLAMHGLSIEAVELFAEMRRTGIRPNRITFLSVLNACSHGGLVEQGLALFKSMVYEYNIKPEIKHFGCIIDMLGRAGRLSEAEKIIGGLPMEVNTVVWRTLLGCCSKYGEVEMGERAMKKILDLQRESGADFAVLSNLLTELGRFSDAESARKLVDERNAVKVPGLALVAESQ